MSKHSNCSIASMQLATVQMHMKYRYENLKINLICNCSGGNYNEHRTSMT